MIRTILFATIVMSGMAVKAQIAPSSFGNFGTMGATPSAFLHPQQVSDTNSMQKKWFVTKYAGISTGFVAFGGRGTSFLSVPLALQVNRKLTNNLYAFGALSVAPYMFHNNGVPYQTGINKKNSFMQANKFAAYSDANIGVMYINNERTFSISGSIGVSRGNFNSYSPVYAPVYAPAHAPVLRNAH